MTLRRSLTAGTVVAATAAALLMGATERVQSKTASLQGVWRVTEVTIPGPVARTVRPVSSLAIIAGKHYSRVEVHAEQARPMLADPAAATADELRAVWGPFVGEAGTYEVTSDRLTMRPIVAKNPAAMATGAFTIYSYTLSGDTATLTMERNQNGPIPNPPTIKIVRVE